MPGYSHLDNSEDEKPARPEEQRIPRDGQGGCKAPDGSQHRAKGVRIANKRGLLARWYKATVTGSSKLTQSFSLLSSRSQSSVKSK